MRERVVLFSCLAIGFYGRSVLGRSDYLLEYLDDAVVMMF